MERKTRKKQKNIIIKNIIILTNNCKNFNKKWLRLINKILRKKKRVQQNK